MLLHRANEGYLSRDSVLLAPASTQDWSSQLEAGISGRRIINIHRLLLWVQTDRQFFQGLKFLSLLSHSLFFPSLAHSLEAWGCTHSAFSCALCFSWTLTFLHTSVLPFHPQKHTYLTQPYVFSFHSATHSPYTPHIFSSLILHMFISLALHFHLTSSLDFYSSQSFVDTPKTGTKKGIIYSFSNQI